MCERRQPFNLERLDNCEVLLLDHSETVQADYITNCRIFIGTCDISRCCGRLLHWGD